MHFRYWYKKANADSTYRNGRRGARILKNAKGDSKIKAVQKAEPVKLQRSGVRKAVLGLIMESIDSEGENVVNKLAEIAT